MNKTIRKSAIFLFSALGIVLLSFYIYSRKNSADLSISLDEIQQIIDDHNANADTYERMRCDENLEITQVLNADIDNDRRKELIVNLACNKLDSAVGGYMYLLVLEKSKTQWNLKFTHPYYAFHSKAALEDFDGDGKNEIFIQSHSGLGGGSAGSSKGIFNQYIKCDQTECQKSFDFWNFTLGHWRSYSITNIRGAFPNIPFLGSTDITLIDDGKILATSSFTRWVGENILFSAETRTLYELSGLEYKKSYQTTTGDSYWIDQRSSYLFWQNNFAEHSLDTGYVYPYIEIPLLEDFQNFFTEAENTGLVVQEDVFYLGGADNSTKLLVGQATDEGCSISVLYAGYTGEVEGVHLTESCTRGSASISRQNLDPQDPEQYIIFSTTFSSFDAERPPYQTISIYKFTATDRSLTQVQLTKVDHLIGMLYRAALDGVTISCDGISPCTAKVRTWDFDNYAEDLSLPHFEYYIWDTEREKFVPQK